MIFDLWPLPRAPWVGAKESAVAHPVHVSNSQAKFGWISSSGLEGDSVTDGQTDGWTEANSISPLLFFFFKKSVGIINSQSCS